MSNARYRNVRPPVPTLGDLAVMRMFEAPVKPRGRWRLLLPALWVVLAWCAAAAGVVGLSLLLSGCATDPVVRNGVQRMDRLYEQDRRPVLEDAVYMALPEGQRKYFLPRSLYDAGRFERSEILKYAND